MPRDHVTAIISAVKHLVKDVWEVHNSISPVRTLLSLVPAQGDRLFSQAHDDLYQLSFERQRWGPLVLRPSKKGRQEKQEAAAPAANSAAASQTDAGSAAAAKLSGVYSLQYGTQAGCILPKQMCDSLCSGHMIGNSYSQLQHMSKPLTAWSAQAPLLTKIGVLPVGVRPGNVVHGHVR